MFSQKAPEAAIGVLLTVLGGCDDQLTIEQACIDRTRRAVIVVVEYDRGAEKGIDVNVDGLGPNGVPQQSRVVFYRHGARSSPDGQRAQIEVPIGSMVKVTGVEAGKGGWYAFSMFKLSSVQPCL